MMPFAFALLVASASAVSAVPVETAAPVASPAANLPAPLTADERRFNACIDKAVDDPASGIAEASQWQLDGGRYFAAQCLGFSYAQQQQWGLAARAFISAAHDAEQAHDRRAAKLWAQAGNAALASADASHALQYFDAALIQGTLGGLNKGEIHLDRARALVALGRSEDALNEFDEVHTLAAQDPLGWLLSATLARRVGKLPQAKADIAIALKLAPSDPAISLELGNIAASEGNFPRAREQWRNCIQLDKQSDAAQIALSQIAQLDATEQTSPAPIASAP